jgi:transposase
MKARRRPPKPLTDAKRLAVHVGLLAGLRYRRIARLVGVGLATISKLRREAGR